MDGRFALPFTELFRNIPWGEGGMTQGQVQAWISKNGGIYDDWYSSDYSKFDTSQPAWLLEDVFDRVVRPCFGALDEQDESWFAAMKNSYIHKEIHAFDGIYKADGCQLSGALTTYAYNTIVNEIIDRTVLLMQGCDLRYMWSLKCGDDNLTFYTARVQPWDRKKHCELIQKYFGIKTTMDESDTGTCSKGQWPKFLSRTWTPGGLERPLNEVLWNLVYPERFRVYDPAITGVSEQRAEALLMYSACLEQDATMKRYFDVDKIQRDAQVSRGSVMETYKAVARLGSGFNTDWLNWKFGNLRF
jgi:hypothetical protein